MIMAWFTFKKESTVLKTSKIISKISYLNFYDLPALIMRASAVYQVVVTLVG